jgi:uncharacterized protein
LKISGSYTLPFARERVYQMLQDPEILAQCMPGTDHLAKIGPDEYEMKMKMVISAVQGLFAGKIRVADQKPPEHFRLLVEGSGKVGFLKGDGVLTLVPSPAATSDASTVDSSTEVHYAGDVQVGGVIAGVGQRLLDTTAKLVIRKFFEKLMELAGESSKPAVV